MATMFEYLLLSGHNNHNLLRDNDNHCESKLLIEKQPKWMPFTKNPSLSRLKTIYWVSTMATIFEYCLRRIHQYCNIWILFTENPPLSQCFTTIYLVSAMVSMFEYRWLNSQNYAVNQRCLLFTCTQGCKCLKTFCRLSTISTMFQFKYWLCSILYCHRQPFTVSTIMALFDNHF